MSDAIAQRYRRLAADFAETVAAVPDDGWSNPSPCEEWTARDVFQHVVDSHETFLGLIRQSLPKAASAASADDPVGAFAAARASVQANLDDPEAANTEYEGQVGRMTFAQGIDAFLCFDLNVHRWDLAQAVGLPARLDPAEVSRLREEASGFGDALRGPDWFGPEIDPPAGADDQTKLLAFLGRSTG